MRRWLTAVALGSVAVLAVTGCSNPGGVDGTLTDDWATVTEPKPFVPDAGTCHVDLPEVGYVTSYRPVDCASPHLAETAHVGSFTGEAAARVTPPRPGTPELRAAFAECDVKVGEYLGASWRSARLNLAIVLPSEPGWSGGARWFRCELTEIQGVHLDDRPSQRSGSLKGILTGPSPLSHGCYRNLSLGGTYLYLGPESCSKPHHSEFAGVWFAPETTYDAYTRDDKRLHRECRKVIARYAKVPDDRYLQYRIGSYAAGPEEAGWALGDRGVRCFVWFPDGRLTRSIKGAGVKALPIN